MEGKHWFVGVLVGAALALGPSGPAAAQDNDALARNHFRLAQAHYDNGDFRASATEFEAAYELSRRPQLLYNIYIAYRDALDLPKAADALRRFIEASPDLPERAQLEARLRELEAALGPRSSGADAQAAGPSRGDEPAMTGEGAAFAEGEGEDEAEQASGADEPAAEASGDAEAGGAALGMPPAKAGMSTTQIASLAVGGLGVAALVTSAVTGVMALGAESRLAELCGPARACDPADVSAAASTASEGSTLALTTDILLVGGVVALGVAGALFFLDGDEEEPSSVSLTSLGCGPTGCAASVEVTF